MSPLFLTAIGEYMAKLLEKNLMGADFARQSFRATPPAGTKIDEMLEPEYWAHVARKFTPYDIVEVVPEDGAFYARLFVASTGKLWAKMIKLECVELTAKKPAAMVDKYEPKYGGPSAKWRAVHKSDGSLVASDSFQTREEVEIYIEKLNKEMAA
jgi:hypothetical protein